MTEKADIDLEALSAEIDTTVLLIQTKVAEQVVQVLEDLRKHPRQVGILHAKILALALRIEQDRTAEAVRIGQKLAEAQREYAVKVFDEVFDPSRIAGELVHPVKARAYFLEKLGTK